MKAPEEIADQSRRGVQVLARAADRRRQSLVSPDRAIELLNVVGVICSACVPSAAAVAISSFSIFP